MTLMSKLAALLLCATTFAVGAQPIEVETPEPVPAEMTAGPADATSPDPQAGDRNVAKPQNPAAAKMQPAPVPEPAHYKLMLLGIAVLLLFARRGAPRDEPWTK